MVKCRACALRIIRSIAGDGIIPTALVPRPLILTPRIAAQPARRRYANAVTAAAAGTPIADQNHAPSAKDALSTQEAQLDAPRSNRSGAIVIRKEKALKKELAFLKDPVKLADHVHYTLRCNNPEKALDLCRLASKDATVVVAWNHVIDWHMRQRKVNTALQIYNEMKKRGQFPDSYTYMLLLRGFPQTRTHGGPEVKAEFVTKAINLYNSMSSPTSRVKASILHTNAVLRVCSLAQDMDALWSVASKIPEHGAGAADHITYSILIGAIRHGASGRGDDQQHLEHFPIEQIARKRQQAVDEGRRIWQEAINRWRSGEVMIDESLVVEMANLLLYSKRIEDWDDVLNLVQQTTQIKRLIAPVGSPHRQTAHVPADAEPEAQAASSAEENDDGWTHTPASNAFAPVAAPAPDLGNPNRAARLSWVTPGNGILNVLIQACTVMRTPRTAYEYWEKLTSDYHVKPDRPNFHSVLGLLKINRSSARCVAVLRQMHEYGVEPRNMTYRLAMSACQRNWKNASTMEHATALIDDMEKHLTIPDASTLESFLSLAVKNERGPQIIAALNRVDSFVQTLGSRAVTSDVSDTPSSAHLAGKQESLAFLKAMIRTIDVLLHGTLAPDAELERWNERRSQLNALVGKAVNSFHHQRERIDERKETVREYGLAKKTLRLREQQLVDAGLRKPKLGMQKDKWSERVERFKFQGGRGRARPMIEGKG